MARSPFPAAHLATDSAVLIDFEVSQFPAECLPGLLGTVQAVDLIFFTKPRLRRIDGPPRIIHSTSLGSIDKRDRTFRQIEKTKARAAFDSKIAAALVVDAEDTSEALR